MSTGVRLAKGFVQEEVALEAGHLGADQYVAPFRFVLDRACARRLAGPGRHFLAVSADAGSRVVSALVDGALCDGGGDEVQGWSSMPTGADDPLAAAAGLDVATVGPAEVGVSEVLFFSRYLRTTEMLGTSRARGG